MESKIKLLPCPFCGGQAHMEPWHGGGPNKRMISCIEDNCMVNPQVTGSNSRLAARSWNTRAPQA
jgi:hypothetical protein